jgi:hypothetical protein
MRVKERTDTEKSSNRYTDRPFQVVSGWLYVIVARKNGSLSVLGLEESGRTVIGHRGKEADDI